VRLPDIEIIDAESGTKVDDFFTGGPESMITFSPDGSLVYTISEPGQSYLPDDWQREVIRVFSPKTGSLIRTMISKGTGLHSVMAISRDGRYIAAAAPTPLWHFPLSEDLGGGVNDRYVVLEAASGEVIFRCIEKTSTIGASSGPFLSPDGRILIVGFPPGLSRKELASSIGHITAYALP
jgi:hypothetical protein